MNTEFLKGLSDRLVLILFTWLTTGTLSLDLAQQLGLVVVVAIAGVVSWWFNRPTSLLDAAAKSVSADVAKIELVPKPDKGVEVAKIAAKAIDKVVAATALPRVPRP